MNLKFRLHSKLNRTGESSIYLRANSKGKGTDIRTGLKINPKYWNNSKGEVKNTTSFPLAFEFRTRLSQISQLAHSVYNQYKIEHGYEPQLKLFKKQVEDKLFGTESIHNWNIISYYDRFIGTLPRKLNSKGRPYTKAYIGGHKNTLLKLKEFTSNHELPIDFDNIDKKFMDLFLEFLNAKNYRSNYIGRQIKHIRTVLNEATQEGINKNLSYKKFKEITEESSDIYLSEAELNEMYELDLSDNKRLEQVRDIFLVSAWTALRYGDMKDFNAKANIQDNLIYIKTSKSQKYVPVPLHPITKEILNKYKHRLPIISNVKYNAYIKEVASLIPGLQKDVEIEYTQGGKLIKEIVPKYTLVKTHTARRSFATNMFLTGRFPIQSIMQVTGHSKESTFYKYIKLPPDYHAKRINDFFNEQAF